MCFNGDLVHKFCVATLTEYTKSSMKDQFCKVTVFQMSSKLCYIFKQSLTNFSMCSFPDGCVRLCSCFRRIIPHLSLELSFVCWTPLPVNAK